MPNQEQGNPPLEAIGFPEHSENSRPANVQPRQPANLQGLLRFATEVTRNEDAPGTSNLPMDEERKRFLEEAISSLTVNVSDQIITAIQILGDQEVISAINCDAEVPDDVMQAFDSLMDIVINLDMSIGFYKLDGYKIFPICLSSENAEVRSQACQLLAEISQNNPFCQSRALDGGFIHILLNILKGEENQTVLKSALYAASCLVREHDQCATTFLSEGGCSALVRCIKRPCSTLRNKAAFIVCHIYPQYPEMKENAPDLVDALATALRELVDDNPAHLLNALRIIVTGSTDRGVILESLKPELKLKESIERHRQYCMTDSIAYAEEIDYCNDVLKVLSLPNKGVSNSSEETGIDR